MPFEDDEQDLTTNQKPGLKNISSQKSIFENKPKKPSQEEFEKKINRIDEQENEYKQKASEYTVQFRKMLNDKTLTENKSVFAVEMEQETISKMVKLAADLNSDPNEQECIGSLMWITVLLRTVLSQRDRINNLEYALSQLLKKSSQT